MFGYGMGDWGAMGGFGFVFWLVILAAVIAAVVWFARSSPSDHHGLAPPPPERRSRGLEALDERYARGEITREEYLQKKRDIAD
jgi:putative membrane protein